VALAVILALLVGCGPAQTDGEHVRRFEDESMTEVHIFFVPEDQPHLEVGVATEVSAGQVQWVLVDPSGDAVWSENATSTAQWTETFPAASGTWRITMRVVDATGEYHVTWLATEVD
jgi:hypothetical protein